MRAYEESPLKLDACHIGEVGMPGAIPTHEIVMVLQR